MAVSNNVEEKLKLLSLVFTPSSPIISKSLFLGRFEQINKLFSALSENGQHAILFGNRGVGKTSLANVLEQIINGKLNTPFGVIRVTCNSNDTFKTIWQKMLERIEYKSIKPGVGFAASSKEFINDFSKLIPLEGDLTVTEISRILSHFPNHIVLIFDEFDTIKDKKIKTQFAELIKELSDNQPKIKIIIVGIGQNVTQLIGEHPSIERCLKQILMPKMSREELGDIIDNGLKQLKLQIDLNVKNIIIDLSSGFPHYTHLLAKFSAMEAILSKNNTINMDHFYYAINEAIDGTNESLKDSYQKAVTSSKKESKFENVLISCSITEEDQVGCFNALSVVEAYKKVTGNDIKTANILYNINKLCTEKRGDILEKIGKDNNTRYKFKNPLLKVFIRIKFHKKSEKENKK